MNRKYELNIEIENFIKEKDAGGYTYSPADIAYIQQYTGMGGHHKDGAKGSGILHEYFTPDFICNIMYQLALFHGYDGGHILEPSIGTGKMIKPFPDKSKVVGFEVNPLIARITEISYPQVKIYKDYFECAFMEYPRFTNRIKKGLTWLKEYPFSLVIGNPPYGKHKNLLSSYFRHPTMKQIELFFMYYGLKLLKPGGLLIYLTASNFLRNGITYNSEKSEISKLANLIDAYRLPSFFEATTYSTDILIFKRK